MMKVVPWPGLLCTSIAPPMRSIFARTTSMPTPRPETAVTAGAVEKPARKMNICTCRSGIAANSAALARPLARAWARIRSTGRPPPSSPTSMMMWPPS